MLSTNYKLAHKKQIIISIFEIIIIKVNNLTIDDNL